MALNVGQSINVPCVVSKGAFPGESLVTVDTMTGPVSGFVSSDSIGTTSAGETYLTGVVKEINGDEIVALLSGSFFTTTGIAYFQRDSIAA
jgi:hypothetical protein